MSTTAQRCHDGSGGPATVSQRKKIVAHGLHLYLIVFFYFCLFAGNSVRAGESGAVSGMTAAHNTIRKHLGIAPLVWSDVLAEYAGNWAVRLAENNNCHMRHSRTRLYGENLYHASAVQWSDGKREVQKISAQHVVKRWQREEHDYDHRTKKCRKGALCGHYTQIIWKNTKELGCGMAICADKGQIWVCTYSPPGNFIGESAY
jgi:pathogenesis-related protein 1